MTESPFDPREFWLRTVKFVEDQVRRENVNRASWYLTKINNWIQNHRDRYGLDYDLSVSNLGQPPEVPTAIDITATAFPDVPTPRESETPVCDAVEIPRRADPPAAGSNVFGAALEWMENPGALYAHGSSPDPRNRVATNPADGKQYRLYQLREPGQIGYVFAWLPVAG